jgi:transposase
VAARDGSQAALAQRFAVSRALVEQLWQRWRRTGSCAAVPHAGGRRRRLRAAAARSRRPVARTPDVPLATRCERVARRQGLHVRPQPRGVEIQRVRLPRKKRRSTPLSAIRRG